MKKLSIILACLLGMVSFTSCEEDRDPVLQTPTTFVLNTPVFQNEYYGLTDGNTFELVCSQPNYGYSAVANYSAEVSLTEDFAKSIALEPKEIHQSRMVFEDNDLAVALTSLHGFSSEADNYVEQPAGKVYFRAVCEIDGAPWSLIKSKPVVLNRVKFYFAERKPGFIYMIGNVSGGWIEPSAGNAASLEPWRLFEADDAIGSKVYSGTFTLPSAPIFRFYTALTGWDGTDSYGSQAEDSPIDVALVDGSLKKDLVKGKGSFSFPAFAGGNMKVTVDMSKSPYSVEFIEVK